MWAIKCVFKIELFLLKWNQKAFCIKKKNLFAFQKVMVLLSAFMKGKKKQTNIKKKTISVHASGAQEKIPPLYMCVLKTHLALT